MKSPSNSELRRSSGKRALSIEARESATAAKAAGSNQKVRI